MTIHKSIYKIEVIHYNEPLLFKRNGKESYNYMSDYLRDCLKESPALDGSVVLIRMDNVEDSVMEFFDGAFDEPNAFHYLGKQCYVESSNNETINRLYEFLQKHRIPYRVSYMSGSAKVTVHFNTLNLIKCLDTEVKDDVTG